MKESDSTQLHDRLARLRDIVQECGSICLGYSGGVDSVFLARFALDVLGAERVLAVTGRSAAVPSEQLEVARACARDFGIPHLEVDTDELADPNYAANPSNRCYFCKTELWLVLGGVAREHGLQTIVDGSNADDLTDYRPGAQAARESAVRSPLAEAGLTKTEIRDASHAYGLPTWDAPSSPCLASRLPYGLSVTPIRLQQVETAERKLREIGFREFRVRHHGAAARVELSPRDFDSAASMLQALRAAVLEAGFERVLLDVEGYRRGALNESLNLVQLKAAP